MSAAIIDAALEIRALASVPVVEAGDDLSALIAESLADNETTLRDGDVLVIASKLVSRAENRFCNLGHVQPSARAIELGAAANKDPRLVELILRESEFVSRIAAGVIVVKNRLGVVCANAGIDLSNAQPRSAGPGSGPWALLLPLDPDASARVICKRLVDSTRAQLGVIISDSIGRPFRLGTVGVAIGLSGVAALCSHLGRSDLFGRPLEHTVTAFADQIATAADLVAGQGAERRGVVLVRGLQLEPKHEPATRLVRQLESDLYVWPIHDEKT